MDAATNPVEPSPIDVHIGRRIREVRIAHGWTRRAFAAALGVSIEQLRKYENGLNRVTVAALLAGARALGISAGSVLDGLDRTAGPEEF
jgi:transcriptional regulator with XRE-family HTH domain